MVKDHYPKRIICLTEETTETLYLLGEQDRIVGISGFTVRPPQARKEKPKVSTFIDAKTEEILDLKPDLVIGFSDIQAAIAKELIEKGVTVWVNNYRSVEGVFDMIFQLGSLVGKQQQAQALIEKYQSEILKIQRVTEQWAIKPKVYFEEWYDPLITAIEWVGDLIVIAGGENVFADKSKSSLAKGRILADHQEVIDKNPDIILASWCGKMFKKDKMLSREGWEQIDAIKNDEIYEIDSSIILQPGPASVGEGLAILHDVFKHWVDKNQA